MASKGPKANAPLPVVESVGVTPVAPASAEAIPAVLAATKPVPVKRIAPVPKPLAAAPATIETPAPVESDTRLDMPPAPAAAATPTPEPAPAAAPAPAPTRKEALMETVTNVAEKTEAHAKALFTETTDRAKSALEKGTRLFADINDFSKGNVEAVVESTKIAAKGAEEVARYSTDYAKATVEKFNATARQFASVKSPTEFLKLQSELAKDTVDSFVAEGAKFTENYLKLLGEIAQPISNRVAVAAEKLQLAA